MQIQCILNIYDGFRVTYVYIDPGSRYAKLSAKPRPCCMKLCSGSFKFHGILATNNLVRIQLSESHYMHLTLTFVSE